MIVHITEASRLPQRALGASSLKTSRFLAQNRLCRFVDICTAAFPRDHTSNRELPLARPAHNWHAIARMGAYEHATRPIF